MALFSSPSSPEIRQAQQPDNLQQRRNIIVITSIGYLERSIQAMDSYRADAVVEYNPSTAYPLYDEPATPTPEPGSVTALQDYYREKARIAHETDGLMPAYEMSEDVARSRQDIYRQPNTPRNIHESTQEQSTITDVPSTPTDTGPAVPIAPVAPLTSRIAAANPDITMQSKRPA